MNTIHGGRAYQYAAVELEAGKRYPIRLAFHEYLNDAAIQLVWSRPNMIHEGDAIDAARQADAVVMVMGLSPRLEGEEMRVQIEGFSGGDRVQIGLPRVQEELMQKVAALGKPTVLVLLNGSAVAVNWAKDHIPAIVEAWYPGSWAARPSPMCCSATTTRADGYRSRSTSPLTSFRPSPTTA